MFRRKNKNKRVNRSLTELPLALPSEDGEILLTCKPEVVDNLRRMLTRIVQTEEFPAKLALLSALRGEGVTYLSRAMGTVMAHDLAKSVCIVDLNWQYPSQPLVPIHQSHGLAAAIAGQATVDEIIVRTGKPNLAWVPAGEIDFSSRPIVARSTALKEVIRELEQQFDHLIFDVPSVLSSSDSIALASLADACCVVIKHGVTSIENVRLALDDINHLRMLGVVMNQVELETPSLVLRYIPQA